MQDVPENLKYTQSHEWVLQESENQVRVGITDHAQSQLGDMVFIELPELDTDVDAGENCVVVESVKAASDVYAPVTGKIIQVNEDLESSPELVNAEPYTAGWLCILEVDTLDELGDLMDAEAYANFIEESA